MRVVCSQLSCCWFVRARNQRQNPVATLRQDTKLNCQLGKQIYRGDDVCIDFGAQTLRYSKKEICFFDFAYGLKEREIFGRKRRVRLIWNESRRTEEKLRMAYHLSVVWLGLYRLC